MKKPTYTHQELEFLPSALEILETPTSPIGRRIIYVIITFFLVALTWSIVGRTETVVTATGKLIPSGYVKVIQSADGGVIDKIFVKDGDKIQKGMPLIQFDTHEIKIAYETIKAERDKQYAQNVYYGAFLDTLNTKKFVQPVFDDLLSETKELYSGRLQTQWQAYTSKLALSDTQIDQIKLEQQSTQKKIDNLQEKLKIWDLKKLTEQKLYNKGLGSKLALDEVNQKHAEITRAIEIEQIALKTAKGKIKTVTQEKDEFVKNTHAGVLDKFIITKDALKKANLELDLQKEKLNRSVIRSPIDGTIEQLQIHTIDGVVKPAQAIATIVPEGESLIVEAYILNKDSGFIRLDQTARIKVDSFPFTKYGFITGKVDFISSDAQPHQTLGTVYKVHIKLDTQYLKHKNTNNKIPLSTGMTTTTEIKTGNRRVIEYILSPLVKTIDESLKER